MSKLFSLPSAVRSSRCRTLSIVTAVFLAVSTVALAKDPTADTSNPADAKTPGGVTANPTGEPANPAGFIRPGIIVSRAQLDEIKKRVATGVQPQKAAFDTMKASPLAALDYTPHPWATVECV